jgi:hypothetical protein
MDKTFRVAITIELKSGEIETPESIEEWVYKGLHLDLAAIPASYHLTGIIATEIQSGNNNQIVIPQPLRNLTTGQPITTPTYDAEGRCSASPCEVTFSPNIPAWPTRRGGWLCSKHWRKACGFQD